MMDDASLLESYARNRSEEAFAEVVRRHLTLVYSAALRRTDGDAHRAKDVAQIVFTALARDAAALSRHAALTGWFYTATRNAAIDLMRAERRRQQREEKAHTMEEILSSRETSPDWEQLRPVLDDAMDELDDRDREAVLLRFFEGQPFVTVAAALRVNEDAVRKRVDRALDKLGALLSRKGITSTSGALALLLANQTAIAAPASVAVSITSAALASAGASAVAAGAAEIFIMSTSKIVTGITAAIACVAISTAVYQAKVARESAASAASTSAERDDLRARLGAMEKRTRQADDTLAATQKELVDLRASAAKPAAAPTTPKPVSQGVAMDYVLEHPETHAAHIEQQRLRAQLRYDRFLKGSGLSPEQQERLLKTMTDGVAGEFDFMVALHAQGYGVGSLPQDPKVRAEFQKMATEQKERFERDMRGVLGDDGYKSFQQYSATIPERNVADQIASQLYYTSESLTSQQAERLAEILGQNRFAAQPALTQTSLMNGTEINQRAFNRRVGLAMQQGGMSLMDWLAPVTDGAVAAAQTVLTPVQLAALRHVQAQQVLQFKLAPVPAAKISPPTQNTSGK